MHHRFVTDERLYEFSMWNRWEERSRVGRSSDEERIQEEAYLGIASDVREAWIEDEMWIAKLLSNSMHASLVVAIWSEMEHFLKGRVEECQLRLGQTVGSPFKFHEIRALFQNELSVNITALPDFITVDAVRILNNSCKHNDGVYCPEPHKPHTIINPTLLAQWSVLGPSTRIAYSILPCRNLVMACGHFADRLSAAT